MDRSKLLMIKGEPFNAETPLEGLRETLANRGDLAQLLRRVATEPAFKRRATDVSPAPENP